MSSLGDQSKPRDVAAGLVERGSLPLCPLSFPCVQKGLCEGTLQRCLNPPPSRSFFKKNKQTTKTTNRTRTNNDNNQKTRPPSQNTNKNVQGSNWKQVRNNFSKDHIGRSSWIAEKGWILSCEGEVVFKPLLGVGIQMFLVEPLLL